MASDDRLAVVEVTVNIVLIMCAVCCSVCAWCLFAQLAQRNRTRSSGSRSRAKSVSSRVSKKRRSVAASRG